ncbi:NusG domain II-containing protein [Gorillibacterium sp. CAU 1737]|uniref:NusG domain II-containing protein n=1 Tax=Gorillibacterium sp. CAU 1737 TaxID=3140362 RepID=UPI00326035EB
MWKLFKKADLILLAVVLVIAAFVIVPSFLTKSENPAGGKLYAQITVDGKPFKTVELTSDVQELKVETKYGYNLLRMHDGGIEMEDADCPDKLCLTFGTVNAVGQTIVCLPHRLMVQVISETGQGGEIDGVAS